MREREQDFRAIELHGGLMPNLSDYIEKYAGMVPDGLALIEHGSGRTVTWRQLDDCVNLVASRLLGSGLKKGDVLATNLPLSPEHVFLICACYRTGIIVAPLDLRLGIGEIQYCFEKIKPSAYFFVKRPNADFLKAAAQLPEWYPQVKLWVQAQTDLTGMPEAVLALETFLAGGGEVPSLERVRHARAQIGKRDACLIIFTTGSTGSPKAALLCHENILIQAIGLVVAFEITPKDRMLVNLPTSHVGCITEQFASILFAGGTAVLLPIFDAARSLEAIQQHRVTFIGQIPALYNLEWNLSAYKQYDLSSLSFAIYGGQTVSLEFLEKMSRMAGKIGTGLGLTELAGFCTYTPLDASVAELSLGLGYDSPLCPLTIRESMNLDGSAGQPKKAGEVGEICFSGPQVFLGYLGDPESTAATISLEGVCYTGDLGSYDHDGLHFAGRDKLVIKPKGYRVFPEDIERHILGKFRNRVSSAACVGWEHAIYSEAIIAFVEHCPDALLSPQEVRRACRDIATYARPYHVEVIPHGKMPLNRVGKTDYMALKDYASKIVTELRSQGRWDSTKDRVGKA